MDCEFKDIISLENPLKAWEEFLRGKRNKKDVARFSLHLMDNLILLHNELVNHTYKHGGYQAFKINDPKPRDIHKAIVRDRLLHHAIYRVLYPFFDKNFIFDSYSCRLGKGTHKAINRFQKFFYKVSKNNTRTCWVLKCDVRKFFASIDHEILLAVLGKYVKECETMDLLREVIGSFSGLRDGVGLPLGNLTSQLFVNIYLNKFDQFIKHRLKARYYLRFADDFVVLSGNRKSLEIFLNQFRSYLHDELKLELHPNKVSIETFASGIDFLGLIHFSNYRVLRTKTKKRVITKIQNRCNDLINGLVSAESFNQSLQSYLGLLRHCESYNLKQKLLKFCKKCRTSPRLCSGQALGSG